MMGDTSPWRCRYAARACLGPGRRSAGQRTSESRRRGQSRNDFVLALSLACAAPAIFGCHRSAGASAQLSHASQERSRAQAGMHSSRGSASFLVQGPVSTALVPTDVAREVAVLPGIWTSSESTLRGRVELAVRFGAEPAVDSYQVPICPDADLDAPCTLDPRGVGRLVLSLDVERHAALVTAALRDDNGRACDCIALLGISTDTPTLDPEEQRLADALGLDASQYLQLCHGEEPAELEASSVLGGVLYRNGMRHEGTCAGLNIYTGATERVALREIAKEPSVRPSSERSCTMAFAELDTHATDGSQLEILEGEDLDQCGDLDEMQAWILRRGMLYLVEGEIQSAGGGCSCVRSVAADATTCPTVSDPCGEADLFRPDALADREFWISSDNAFALTLKDHRASVLRPAGGEVRSASIDAPVLGVEYHPGSDLIDLVDRIRGREGVVPTDALVRIGSAALDELEGRVSRSARQYGERCFARMRAGDLDIAFSECIAGLAAGGSDSTRAALTYNLGTIAFRRSDFEVARQWLARSLRLRPGNTATLERLGEVDAALVGERTSRSLDSSMAR